jgi:hypothetical protein
VLTSYLCTIAGDGEGNPLTNFLDEEAGGSSRAEFRMKDFGRNVDESGQERIQKSKSGQAHAEPT